MGFWKGKINMLLQPGYLQGALHDVIFIFPIASDDDYISSSSDAGSPAAFDCSASEGGDEVFRSAQGKKPFPGFGRLPQVTKTDASGTSLTVTVTVEGYRFGKFVSQDIACVASGTETVKGTKIIDEVSRVFIKSIENNTTSDTIKVGLDDSWLGLPFDIKSKDAIRSILKIAVGTPDANGPKINSDVTDAMVKLEAFGSGIDVKTLYSGAIAVTQQYLMKVINDGTSNLVYRSGSLMG